MSSKPNADWLEPVTVNKTGSRCVVETNWHDNQERCQMIWERLSGGGVVITTCRKTIPGVAVSKADVAELSSVLRDGGYADGASVGIDNHVDGSGLLSIGGGDPLWLTGHQRSVLAYWLGPNGG